MKDVPRKKFQLELKMEAHTFKQLVQQLYNFSLDLQLGDQPDLKVRNMMSTSGYTATLKTDDNAPDEKEYTRLLLEWRESYLEEERSKNQSES